MGDAPYDPVEDVGGVAVAAGEAGDLEQAKAMHATRSEHLDVVVAHPGKLKLIARSDKKTDRVDAKELARLLRLDSVPESYVPTDEIREARALVRGRQTLVEDRTKFANKIHGLLADHGITREVKPLSVKGREFL